MACKNNLGDTMRSCFRGRSVLVLALSLFPILSCAGTSEKLGRALEECDSPGVRAALEAGADPNRLKPRPLDRLLRSGCDNMYGLAALLLDHGMDCTLQQNDVYHLTIVPLPVVDLLLSSGAAVDSRWTGYHGATALMLVARDPGRSDMVRLLLERGADPLLTDDDGNTALHYLFRHTGRGPEQHRTEVDLESLSALLEARADVNACNAKDQSVLYVALYALGEERAAGFVTKSAWENTSGPKPRYERPSTARRESIEDAARILLQKGAKLHPDSPYFQELISELRE